MADMKSHLVIALAVGLLVLLTALYVFGSGPAQLLIARDVISFETYCTVYRPLYLASLTTGTDGPLIRYWVWWAAIGGAAPWVP